MTVGARKTVLTKISNRTQGQIRQTLILSSGLEISKGLIAYNSCMYVGDTCNRWVTDFQEYRTEGPARNENIF